MQRRRFLSAACALTAGAAVEGHRMSVVRGGEFTNKIRKAVKFHMVTGESTVEDKFRLLKDIGFDGVETRVALGNQQTDLVRSYLQASEKVGLPIHGVIHSSNPTLVEAIDQARFLGANSVLHVVRYDRNIGYLENYRQTQSILRSAIDHAEKHQVQILLENVWATFLIEPMAMARYVDELNSPMVGVYFDVGNVVRWGWPQHWIEVLGSRIKKLDIKEYDLDIAMNEGMRKGFDRPLGGGSIDWKQVRSELAKLRYQGWATAEVKGGDRDRLTDIAQQMDAVLDLSGN